MKPIDCKNFQELIQLCRKKDKVTLPETEVSQYVQNSSINKGDPGILNALSTVIYDYWSKFKSSPDISKIKPFGHLLSFWKVISCYGENYIYQTQQGRTFDIYTYQWKNYKGNFLRHNNQYNTVYTTNVTGKTNPLLMIILMNILDEELGYFPSPENILKNFNPNDISLAGLNRITNNFLDKIQELFLNSTLYGFYNKQDLNRTNTKCYIKELKPTAVHFDIEDNCYSANQYCSAGLFGDIKIDVFDPKDRKTKTIQDGHMYNVSGWKLFYDEEEVNEALDIIQQRLMWKKEIDINNTEKSIKEITRTLKQLKKNKEELKNDLIELEDINKIIFNNGKIIRS
jgi:hypothetical protein